MEKIKQKDYNHELNTKHKRNIAYNVYNMKLVGT